MNVILYLGIILFSAKGLGLLARKIGLPQVVGMVIAGLLIGPALFSKSGGSFKGIINPTEIELDVLKAFSQIGVILILFSSGLETDIRDIKKNGVAATAIACAGVLVPILLGTIVSLLVMGGLDEVTNSDKLLNAVFIGIILSATSVGITVETLRELGKLEGRIGTTILSAAIIDDIIGIVAISILTSVSGGGSIVITLIKMASFFVLAIGLGFVIRKIFKWLVTKYPHKRRTSIFALALCFLVSYCAEEFFGMASITGAFVVGIILSGLNDTSFVDRKILISGYMIFTPIFFAYIGISADFSHFQFTDIFFAASFIAVGLIGKIVGCALTAKPFGYTLKESSAIGCGMIARGEVALAVYATGSSMIYYGADGTLLGIDPLVATIFLIVISSIMCPILLKVCFKGHRELSLNNNTTINTSELEGGYAVISADNHEPTEIETQSINLNDKVQKNSNIDEQ